MSKLQDARKLPIFIHSSVDDMTDLTPNAMRVYMHLARRADKNGVAWPSYQSIGDHCFASISDNAATRKSFARKAIDELIAAKLIAKQNRSTENGSNRSNDYVLLDPVPIDTPVLNKHTPVPIDTTPCLLSTKGSPSESTPIEDTPLREGEAAAAPPAPPAPPKRSPSSDPAVGVYVDIYGRYPDKAQCALIADSVTELDAWRNAVRAWMGRGYSPRNVLGMLEWYADPSKYLPKRATDYGRAAPKSKVEASFEAIDRVFDRLAQEGAFAHA